jgi:hypothetical protein
MSTAESGRETEKFSARVSDEYAPSVKDYAASVATGGKGK